jgi:hypothetical protein
MRIRRHRWAMMAAALALTGAPARAEDAAALLARAPALDLDGPVRPLAAPLEVARAGWGPFRRLCVAPLIRRQDGTEVPTAPPSCLVVEEAREEAGGTWRLRLRTDMHGRGPEIGLLVRRDAEGRFGPVEIVPPEGVTPPTPAQSALLHRVFQAALEAHGLGRTTLAPGARFVLPFPLAAVERELHVEGGGFQCEPAGEATQAGRRVVVATCTARAGSVAPATRRMSLEAAGRFAIDVEAGLVLRHGYASFLVTEAEPGRGRPPMELRGASRQSLD